MDQIHDSVMRKEQSQSMVLFFIQIGALGSWFVLCYSALLWLKRRRTKLIQKSEFFSPEKLAEKSAQVESSLRKSFNLEIEAQLNKKNNLAGFKKTF